MLLKKLCSINFNNTAILRQSVFFSEQKINKNNLNSAKMNFCFNLSQIMLTICCVNMLLAQEKGLNISLNEFMIGVGWKNISVWSFSGQKILQKNQLFKIVNSASIQMSYNEIDDDRYQNKYSSRLSECY